LLKEYLDLHVKEYVLYWSISIPIEGPMPDDFPSARYSRVLFHIYDDPDLRKKQFFASVILEGQEMSTVGGEAMKLIDDALSKFHLVHGHPLFPDIDDMRIVKDAEGVTPSTPEVGRKRVSSSLTSWWRTGEDRTETLLSQIENIKPEKKNALDKSVAFHRLGVCSVNPYQAIESYFSSLSAIVRENTNGRDPTRHDLRKALHSKIGLATKDFDEKFERYYGERRSAATHGGLNPLVSDEIAEAKKDAADLKSWVKRFLISFVENNQES
jgi:hypothetical protein